MELDDILVATNDPKAQVKQRTLKEMARRSQDRILVFNPLLEDYTVKFDGIGFIIPNRTKDNGNGLGRAIVLRYIAENYRTQMVDKLLTDKMDEAVRLENERRQDLGMLTMTKFIGGEEILFCNSLRTDNEEARAKLIPVVWLGIVERYGIDAKEESNAGKPKDDRTMDERLTEEMERKPRKPVEVEAQNDLSGKDVFTLRKIAKEKGIETAKTDKKDELLRKISQ